jgi:hypothetical protein
MNRTEFLSRHLEYLFSFDLDLGKERRSPARGSHSNLITSHVSRFDPRSSPVYNALGDARVLGETAITGHVACVQERIDFLHGEKYGEINGRLVIRTADACLIEGEYSGVLRAGARWQLLQGDYESIVQNERALETRAQISTHFETGSTKYRWLVQHRCVGYGSMKLKRGEPTWASFDIYALCQQPERSVWRTAL